MRFSPALRSVVPAALILTVVGCDKLVGPGGSQNLQVVMSQGSETGPSFSEAPLFSDQAMAHDEKGRGAKLALADIRSIDVTVTSIKLRQKTENQDSTARSWISVPVSATALNLLALPTTTDKGIKLASGSVPAGTYRGVRLGLSSATITLNRDVTLGEGTASKTYKAGTAYPLQLGSADKGKGETQLEVAVPHLGFTVGSGVTEPLSIVFDVGTSVKNVIVTPEGFRMSPVIRARKDKKHS